MYLADYSTDAGQYIRTCLRASYDTTCSFGLKFLWCSQCLNPQGQDQCLNPQGQDQCLNPQGQDQDLNPQGQDQCLNPQGIFEAKAIGPEAKPKAFMYMVREIKIHSMSDSLTGQAMNWIMIAFA